VIGASSNQAWPVGWGADATLAGGWRRHKVQFHLNPADQGDQADKRVIGCLDKTPHNNGFCPEALNFFKRSNEFAAQKNVVGGLCSWKRIQPVGLHRRRLASIRPAVIGGKISALFAGADLLDHFGRTPPEPDEPPQQGLNFVWRCCQGPRGDNLLCPDHDFISMLFEGLPQQGFTRARP